jgi:hypothetical protein
VKNTRMRAFRGTMAAACATAMLTLTGCGGGGGGDTQDLHVDFGYSIGAQVELYMAPPLPPRLNGLDGKTPNCSMVSGSLPQGVSVGSNCQFQGISKSAGSYAGTVRLTVAGYNGELTANYGFDVVPPQVLQTGINPRALTFGTALDGAPLDTSQVAQLTNYNYHLPTDQGFLTITEGTLPAGVTLELVDLVRLLLKGTPTELGRRDIKVTFTLQRAGQQYVTPPLPLTLEVSLLPLSVSYLACCDAAIGVPFSFTPSTNFVPSMGASIRYETNAFVPDGLSVDPDTGEVRGIPRTAEPPVAGLSINATVTLQGATTSAETVLFIRPAGVYGAYPTSSEGHSASYASGTAPPTSVAHAVSTGVAFTIQPGPIYGARTGDSYRYAIVPNRNYSFPIPDWVSVDPMTGVISGTKLADGVWTTFELDVTLTRGGAEYHVRQYWGIS